MLNTYTQNFYINTFLINDAVNCALTFINETVGLSKEEHDDFKIIFTELFYNAIIHGNMNDDSKKVSVSITINDSEVCATIRDEGDGFDYTKFLSEYKPSQTSESGRGLKIVYALTDSVVFNDKGNEIKFIKGMSLHV